MKRTSLTTIAALVGMLLPTGVAQAGPPRDELLRLVPADVGFVVLIQDLRAHHETIKASPFLKKWRESPMGQRALASPAWKQLEDVNTMLRDELGADAVTLRNDILGDAIAFLWRPGPPGKPDQDDSVVLIRVRDPKLATQIQSNLDRSQKKSGQLIDSESRSLAGRGYTLRKRKGEPDEYQYQRGHLLAFGSSEPMLKDVITADRDEVAKSVPELSRQLRSLGVDTSAMVWWMNARRFDGQLEAHRPTRGTPELAVHEALIKHWRAVDSVVGYLTLDADVKWGFVIGARPEAIPATSRQWLASMAEPSEVMGMFSSDAMITVGGRWDLVAFRAAAEEFMPEEARTQATDAIGRTAGATLGEDTLAKLPAALGPEWGISVAPPLAESAVPTVTIAVRLADTADGAVVPRVLESLNTLASLAVIGYNSSHKETAKLASERQGDVEVRYAMSDRGFPPGLRPAYAWKRGYLVLASHPTAIARFPAEPAGKPATATLLRISGPAWGSYIAKHRNLVASLIAADGKLTLTEAGRKVDELLELLELVSSIEITVRKGANHARVEMSLSLVAPLK